MSIRSIRPWKLAAAMSAIATLVAACGQDEATSMDEQRYTRAGIGGRWVPVKATGNNGRGSYEGPAGEQCAGALRPGAAQLGEQLKAQFNLNQVGGYACRANTANPGQLSVHAIGRAVDLMTIDGDDLANHLVTNAQALGIQLIIWNRTVWQVGANGPTSKAYSGPNPHTDHVHAEVTRALAESGTGAAGDPTTTLPADGVDVPAPGVGDGDLASPEVGWDKSAECRTPAECEDALECIQHVDCDPSGAIRCIHGFCDIGICTEELFRLGVCE